MRQKIWKFRRTFRPLARQAFRRFRRPFRRVRRSGASGADLPEKRVQALQAFRRFRRRLPRKEGVQALQALKRFRRRPPRMEGDSGASGVQALQAQTLQVHRALAAGALSLRLLAGLVLPLSRPSRPAAFVGEAGWALWLPPPARLHYIGGWLGIAPPPLAERRLAGHSCPRPPR